MRGPSGLTPLGHCRRTRQRKKVDYMVHLSELPLGDLIYPYLSMQSLAAIERTNKAAWVLSRQDEALAWRRAVQQRWGPVRVPAKDQNWSATRDWSFGGTRIWPQPPSDWRQLGRYLETSVLQGLQKSVRKAVEELLLAQGLLSAEPPDAEHAWHATVHCLLSWVSLHEKRRLTAFVCAEWQPLSTLPTFFAQLPIRGATPELALRDLLLRFPFLPIDAGQGADRVIGTFSRAYVLQNRASALASRSTTHLWDPSAAPPACSFPFACSPRRAGGSLPRAPQHSPLPTSDLT